MSLRQQCAYGVVVLATVFFAVRAVSGGPQETQSPPTPKASPGKKVAGSSPGDPGKGKAGFESKCAVCHEADSDATKVGPGLKGLFKKHPHQLNGKEHVHNLETVRQQIKKGSGAMPPMEKELSEEELDDLLAYLQTL